MSAINTIDDVKTAVAHLQALDPRFVPVVEAVGMPPLRRREDGFGSLADIIVGQLLSRASADAINIRLRKAITPYTVSSYKNTSDDVLKACGLSRPKIKTFRALTAAVTSQALDLESLKAMSDADVAAALTSVKGIGPWTAEIYLLACLGRADIWPAGDLALQVGVQMMCDLETRPTAIEARDIAAAWQPWRAVAARLLWSYYAFNKKTNVPVG